MKYIIVDPDEQSYNETKKILDSFNMLEIQGNFTIFKNAKKILDEELPDIVFIRIGGISFNAYEFHREIRVRNPFSKVVFMSKHKEYAIEAFECEAVGFLLEPFPEEKIEKLIQRIFKEKECSEKWNLIDGGKKE